MPRYRITIEYDGSPYCGWQRQKKEPSVQAAIESAILAFSGERAVVKGSGRTDTGVHAEGQVAHFDLSKEWSSETIQGALNAHLRNAGDRIAILAAAEVNDGFDARFSAVQRYYRYQIMVRRAPLVLTRDRYWHVLHPLDLEAMQTAADHLVGTHDFTTFRSVQCQAKSPVRTLERLDVIAGRVPGSIHIYAEARSFLHHQIRSFAGTLKRVGEGRWTPKDVKQALEARDRSACGPVGPSCGLYFSRVRFPGEPE